MAAKREPDPPTPPTPFEEWVKAPKLFNDGVKTTRTQVVNDDTLGPRLAYGLSGEACEFAISMTADQEPAFWTAYVDWRKQNPGGDHNFCVDAISKKPPTCGTPYTPPCGPNDLLATKITKLTEEIAGPSATPNELVAIERKVIDMLVATLDGAIALVKNT